LKYIAIILGSILNIVLYGAGFALGNWSGFQTMAVLAVLNFFAIFFHELGHAWAFRHVGGTVHKIVVLFAAFDLRKRRLGWSRLRSGGDVGGYVVGSYRPQGPTIRDKITVSAAGPGANLLTGLSALLAAVILTPPPPHPLIAGGGKLDVVVQAPTENQTRQLNDGQFADLPDDRVMKNVMVRIDISYRRHRWHLFSYAVLVIFGTLALGLALINLLPFAGSDGQHIARALKQRSRLRR
jgi:membrane-associated protease RseP (regulator of RpoE activity)